MSRVAASLKALGNNTVCLIVLAFHLAIVASQSADLPQWAVCVAGRVVMCEFLLFGGPSLFNQAPVNASHTSISILNAAFIG